jgi:hypothetical protein
MPVHRIKPRRILRLSRGMAFAAQGVTLRYPSHSWSGVRGRDGAVVVAIRAADVRVDDHGCSCLLWAPAPGADDGVEWASHRERLDHCSLAARHGTAEALLASGEEAAFDAHEVITLRVQRIGREYWARWGSVARAENSDRFFVLPGMRPLEACFAA